MRKITIIAVSLLSVSTAYLSAQDGKAVNNKTVCSTPIPSRFPAIAGHKKTAVNFSKKSCCKGVMLIMQ